MTCPHCNGEVIVEGKIYNQVDYFNPPAYFRPTNSPFYAILGSNIKLQNSFFACTLCGFVWSSIDKDALQKL
jgi:hypothetical protein